MERRWLIKPQMKAVRVFRKPIRRNFRVPFKSATAVNGAGAADQKPSGLISACYPCTG